MFFPQNALNTHAMRSDSLTWFRAKTHSPIYPTQQLQVRKYQVEQIWIASPIWMNPKDYPVCTHQDKGIRRQCLLQGSVCSAHALFPWVFSYLGLFCPKGVYMSSTFFSQVVWVWDNLLTSPQNGSEITKENGIEKKNAPFKEMITLHTSIIKTYLPLLPSTLSLLCIISYVHTLLAFYFLLST